MTRPRMTRRDHIAAALGAVTGMIALASLVIALVVIR